MPLRPRAKIFEHVMVSSYKSKRKERGIIKRPNSGVLQDPGERPRKKYPSGVV